MPHAVDLAIYLSFEVYARTSRSKNILHFVYYILYITFCMERRNKFNPFVTGGYLGPEYFCDRDSELRIILDALHNGRSITLYGRRKLGKTALIKHVFHQLSSKYLTVWIDLMPTTSINGLLEATANSLVYYGEKQASFGKKLWESVRKLRPTITYDSLTGQPQLSFQDLSPNHVKQNFEGLIGMLSELKKEVVIAFDEFQQILRYPEENMTAYLRMLVQEVPKVRFIFSGSDQHVIGQMFSKPDQPFYHMTQMLRLEPLIREEYQSFILGHFQSKGTKLKMEDLSFILDWTMGITFPTQYLCNRLYALPIKNIQREDIQSMVDQILTELSDTFYAYRQILTRKQWRVLQAISQEGKVYQPYGKDFMMKFRFTNNSSLRRAIQSLLNSQLLYVGQESGSSWFEIMDVFFSRWLKKMGH
jgi:AAA+ ATPase superfamily predicted ATPase